MLKYFIISEKNRKKNSTISLQEITLLIPFRNEEKRIRLLLDSLQKQEKLPNEIIFINDHSTDSSCTIISEYTLPNKKLIHLGKDEIGKKKALEKGIKAASGKYIHTLDADVFFPTDFFKEIHRNVAEAPLISLPVCMEGKNLLQHIFSLEFNFFNAFNFLLQKLYPLSVNGANLILNKSQIDYQKQLQEHKHLASGDDYFLLKYSRKNKLKLSFYANSAITVFTFAPQKIKEYINQRVRWLQKSSHAREKGEIIAGIYIFIYFIGGFVTLLFAFCLHLWEILGVLILLRFICDLIVYQFYMRKIRKSSSFLLLPLFQFVYPLIFIFILGLAQFYTPKWKERPIS